MNNIIVASAPAFDSGYVTPFASVLNQTFFDAACVVNHCAFVPIMAHRFFVIGRERAAATVANMKNLSTCQAGSGSFNRLVIVRQSFGYVGDVTLVANRTLLEGITGADAGCRDIGSLPLVFALGRELFFSFPTTGTDFK